MNLLCNMAEREGFEPPIALRLCLISSQVHSTGLCHLSVRLARQPSIPLSGNEMAPFFDAKCPLQV